MSTSTPRHLYLSWQDSGTRLYHVVARLTVDDDGYTFAYLKNAEQLDSFAPLVAFPDIHRTYRSSELPSFFANRLMSRSRADWQAFADSHGLPHNADDFEVLAVSGQKVTDSTFEIFAAPAEDEPGRSTTFFFVRGVRHVPNSLNVIRTLEVGDQLEMLQELDNPVSSGARKVLTGGGEPIGYLPSYLIDHVDAVAHSCDDVALSVVAVNPPGSPTATIVRCSLSSCWPEGYRPFAGAEFEPLVG
jgi:hypothetical protein